MNDPDLLPVSEIVSIHLDALKDLSADQWAEYLSIDDVFATYNTDYAAQIDDAYVTQLADAFDYEIVKCTVDGDSADVVLRIRSIDMTNVLTIYKKSLLSYASSSKSIRDDEVTFSNETSRLLLEALQENTETSTTDVDLTFHNNGTVWEIYFGEDFTNALMGDMKGAIETFNTLTRDSLTS
jgi:hypothetical protein